MFDWTIDDGKKENLKVSVVLWNVVMSSELRVLCEWVPLGSSCAK